MHSRKYKQKDITYDFSEAYRYLENAKETDMVKEGITNCRKIIDMLST